MAHGLETRSPFLDTAVVEFGASLPDRLRMRFGKGKVLLRRAMKGILPESILERGKMGFGAPLGRLVPERPRRPSCNERLLDRAEPALRVPRARARGAAGAEHMTEKADLAPQIWALLTLESWLRQEGSWRSSV